jgi:hypothetical protein
MTEVSGRAGADFFAAEQAAKDARSRAVGFTGIDADLVSGRYLLWVAGRIVGAVDDAELAWRLRPVLRDLADGGAAVA